MLAFEIFSLLLHESNPKISNFLSRLYIPDSFNSFESLSCLKCSQLGFKSFSHEGFRTGIFPYEEGRKSTALVRCGAVATRLPGAKLQECVIALKSTYSRKSKSSFPLRTTFPGFLGLLSPLRCGYFPTFEKLPGFAVFLEGGDSQLLQLS